MNRDDIRKLLGGYATGTLTPQEQQALFEAALDDQELFDALAREQALRDLLRDASAKTQLLAALDQRTPSWYERLVRGWRPLAAAVAMAGVGAIAVVVWQNARSPKPVLVARVSPPPPARSPVSTIPAEPSPTPSDANAVQQPTAARDTNARALRDKDAPLGRLAKEDPAKVEVGRGVPEEDRRAKEKQLGAVPERKEAPDSVSEAPSGLKGPTAPLPAAPPRTFASGFREGAATSGVSGNLSGVQPAPRPQRAAEPKAEPLFRSTAGNRSGGVGGGTVGGVLGGVIGGKPGAAPPPPATVMPPKAETQPAQSAQSQAVPSQPATPQAKLSQSEPAQQGQQGQQGAASPSAQLQLGQARQQGAPSELERVQLAQPPGSATQTVEVTAAAASLDARSSQDVKSLFYGNPADSLNSPGARGGAAGGGGYSTAQPTTPARALKKADQPEKAPAMTVNKIAANTRVQAPALNLGVRYSLLRKTAAGRFEQVDPDSLKAGDTLELQLMPNDRGSLLVQARGGDGTWRDAMSTSVEANRSYTTPPLKSDEKELQVMLTRLPVALAGVSLRDDQSGTNVYQRSAPERATYVVTRPPSPLLRFTITLNYK